MKRPNLALLEFCAHPECDISGSGIRGWFIIPYRKRTFVVVASDEFGWEHVSVSCKSHTPSWQEMCYFKDLFFEPEECVIQYHPPASAYVDLHAHCLHLWRPIDQSIPMPPGFLV